MASSEVTSLFGARAVKLSTIGRVIELLTSEFPDLTPSKIRFLEEQGLVTPHRTESGYRKFSDTDIERVKLVLELQRDKFLPLRVIKSYLDDIDAGKQPSLPSATRRPSVNRKFSKLELVAESGINETLLAEAQANSLISAGPYQWCCCQR